MKKRGFRTIIIIAICATVILVPWLIKTNDAKKYSKAIGYVVNHNNEVQKITLYEKKGTNLADTFEKYCANRKKPYSIDDNGNITSIMNAVANENGSLLLFIKTTDTSIVDTNTEPVVIEKTKYYIASKMPSEITLDPNAEYLIKYIKNEDNKWKTE